MSRADQPGSGPGTFPCSRSGPTNVSRVGPALYPLVPETHPNDEAVFPLAGQHEGKVVPPGILLNVNMPARHASEAHGVRLTRQGHSVLYELRYNEQSKGRYGVVFVPGYIEETIPDADTTALLEGYISVTPLEGSWNADEQTWKGFRPLTERLVVPGAALSP